MSASGRKEWNVVNAENEIHTAAKEKTDPEKLPIITRLIAGKYFVVFTRHIVPVGRIHWYSELNHTSSELVSLEF